MASGGTLSLRRAEGAREARAGELVLQLAELQPAGDQSEQQGCNASSACACVSAASCSGFHLLRMLRQCSSSRQTMGPVQGPGALSSKPDMAEPGCKVAVQQTQAAGTAKPGTSTLTESSAGDRMARWRKYGMENPMPEAEMESMAVFQVRSCCWFAGAPGQVLIYVPRCPACWSLTARIPARRRTARRRPRTARRTAGISRWRSCPSAATRRVSGKHQAGKLSRLDLRISPLAEAGRGSGWQTSRS